MRNDKTRNIKRNLVVYIYLFVTFVYLVAGIYLICNSKNIKNTDVFAVSIGALSIIGVAVSTASLAYSFSSSSKTDEMLDDLKDKIEQTNKTINSLISYQSKNETLIELARKNKELYDLNLIDFNEYESKRQELKNKLKEINN